MLKFKTEGLKAGQSSALKASTLVLTMTGIVKAKIGARSRCATSRGRCSEIRQQALQFFPLNPKFSKPLLFDPRNAHPRTLFRSSEEATTPAKRSVTRLEILTLKY